MPRPTRLVLASALIPSLSLYLAAVMALADPPAASDPPPHPPDYVIAFWYLRSDPLTSIRHQVYDVRKGQYTHAVTDWLETLRTRYPAYSAYIKEVRLKPDSDESEKKQLAAVILQEFVAKGGPYGGFGLHDASGLYGSAGRLDTLVGPNRARELSDLEKRASVSTYIRGYGFVNTPGASRPPGFLSSPSQPSSGIPSPFPYPYVRPHP